MENKGFHVYRVKRGSFRDCPGDDVPIICDNNEIGALCPLAGQTKIVSALTTYQQEVLNFEVSADEQAYLGNEYSFLGDYVVIMSEWIDTYNSCRQGSVFWGEYCHEDIHAVSHVLGIPEEQEIHVVKDFVVRTDRHKESLSRYATYSSPLNKFLSLYHCLEIDFDYDIVARVKALDENNPRGLGLALRDLGFKDIERLIKMIDKVPVSVIEVSAYALRRHQATAKSVFYEYGKDSNPIKQYGDYDEYINKSPAISHAEFTRIKQNISGIVLNVGNQSQYEEIIRKCASYWIYRLRCCIAHNKLGEYHISSESDIRLVIEFGIPLLKSVLLCLHQP